ncbi:MAG: hypothetical protein A3B47_02535 [Candidatus Levybacteria bacterium RIFCSPLOWO2_01_FULL_39_24]|nr:MAG: hypothetical protein A2800_01830 [Candidatus Levybacteria bacterium RIFCSPHIGHO2_01_FULL_40_16]OGH28264.1 MAG: hypothetical protein A3E12_02020 [Candidatus Levybacteria bacterium RIFCSPHIGHO2_12_FULL_39_9]OGH46504.1 MAG: hypothetical protein A3B47_02535 [Candidatus Levybacteria bacterium RIFCSPLOWO2_01_FULL_39_24]
MKKCSKCGLSKELKDFYRRKSGLRAGEYYEKCKDCYKIRGKNYYHQNRERQLYLAKKRKLKYIVERKEFLGKIKNKPCFDCGKKYPAWVMDFDHRDGKKKVASISFLTFRKLVKFDKIKEEIAKCDLVCANCHRDRTYRRLQKIK